MRTVIVVAFVVLGIAGCKHKHSTSVVSTNGDEAHHPDITFESPIPEETGVATDAVITAGFDDPMNPTTLTSGNFFLRTGAGVPVPGAVSYDIPTRVATFTPTALLLPSTTYIAELSAYIQNTSGESLGVAHAWKFYTGP